MRRLTSHTEVDVKPPPIDMATPKTLGKNPAHATDRSTAGWSGSTWSEFAYVVAGQMFTAAGAWGGVRLLTEVLSPHEFGLYMLAMTGANFVHQLVFAPLGAATQRFWAAALDRRSLSSYYRAVFQLATRCVAITVLVAFSIFVGCFWWLDRAWYMLGGPTFVFAVSWGLLMVADNLHSAARWRGTVAAHQAVTHWLRWCCAALCAWKCHGTAAAAMWGATAGVLLSGISRCIALQRLLSQSRETHLEPLLWKSQLLEYFLPFTVCGIFTWAVTSSDRWALALSSSAHDVGLYAVLYQLAYFPCVLLGDVIQQFVGPILFEKMGDGSDQTRLLQAWRWHWRVFGIALLTFGGICVLAWCFAEPLLELLAAPNYRSYAAGLPLLALAGSFFSLGQMLALLIIGMAGSRAILWVKISHAIAGIATNFLLAYFAGIPGLLVAMPVSAGLYLLLTARQCHAIGKQRLVPSQSISRAEPKTARSAA